MNTVCISHSEDVDGLCSAVILRIATGAEVILSDYGELVDKLANCKDATDVYICDIDFSGLPMESVLAELKRIRRFAEIHLIDHHVLPDEHISALRRLDLDLDLQPELCSSMMVYNRFERSLPWKAGMFAAIGAIGDRKDTNRKSDRKSLRLIESFYKHFVSFETGLMALAINYFRGNEETLVKMVYEFAESRFPHQMPWVIDAACAEAQSMNQIIPEVARKRVDLRNMAYVEADTNWNPKVITSFLFSSRDIGVAFPSDPRSGITEVLCRTWDPERDVKSVVGIVLGETGGRDLAGHKRICGCHIPHDNIPRFLSRLDEKLETS